MPDTRTEHTPEAVMADHLTKAIGDITAALILAGKEDKIAKWTRPYVEALNEYDAAEPAGEEPVVGCDMPNCQQRAEAESPFCTKHRTGGLSLASGSPTMLQDEFERWEADAASSNPDRLVEAGFRPMGEWDRRDRTVLLLVDYSDGCHALDDAQLAITIGHNNDHNVGDGEGKGWEFAGWCWSHDHYVQGEGKPVGWMPLPHHLADAFAAPAECPSAPNGRHQVDTSMESGPNNCFHCEAPMPALSATPAKATEARRAETGTGSVHDGAVPQAFAQNIPGDSA